MDMFRLGKYLFTAMIFSVFTALFSSGVASSETPKPVHPVISYPVKHDTSPTLMSITPIKPEAVGTIREIPRFPLIKKLPYAPLKKLEAAPVLQYWPGYPGMPTPILTFEGINNINGVLPPDPNGDIGPNHYVQMVNNSFAIWDKAGTKLYGPAANNTLWAGFGGPCETRNDGDPIVLYDHLADRWLMSQFALPNFPDGPFYQCIAISTSPDPTGSWYRYAFLVHNSKINDYAKFGLWPDAYYMSVNQFENIGGLQWAGAGAFAFERDKMLLGQTAQMIYFDLYSVDPNLGGMLPSDLDGPPPPSGSPNYFVQFDDDGWGYPQDQLEVWQFHVDWSNPSNATFTGPTILPVAPFDSNLCNYSRNCIPQPGTAAKVDAISDRLMYRLQYRNFGTHQSMVVNHTVDVDGTNHAGIRWYELRKTTGSWSIFQQGTFSPDSNHRWMGSIAMDSQGNIALGYSVSSSSVYPSIRYVGRLASDPLNTLPQAETTLIAGSGSQTHSSGRWGDYSSMSIDPSDDCTFWYTQEYYQSTSPAGWRTRIGSFRFPSCSGNGGTLQGTVSDALFPTRPIVNARIDLNLPTTAYTDSGGFYQFLNLPAGIYDVTASAYRYTPGTVNGVSVIAGNTTTQNFALTCNVTFNDVLSGYWAENYIKSMYCREITNGCSTSPLMYCPEKVVTRKVMAVFIIRALGETPSSSAYNAYFDDIVNDWFAPYINRLYELNITQGCGTRLFCPDNIVKRGPLAVLIIRALGETPSSVTYNAYFDDIANDWFSPYINRMYELGLTTGCGTRLFCPYKDVNRAQAASFIIRAF